MCFFILLLFFQIQFAVNQVSWVPGSYITLQLSRGAVAPSIPYRFASSRRTSSVGYFASPRIKISYSSVANRDCVTYASSLEGIVTCIRNQMPQANWNQPSAGDLSAFSSLVSTVLSSASCQNINVGATSLSGIVKVSLFREGSSSYCILHEILDADNNGFVDRGLGTLIVGN